MNINFIYKMNNSSVSAYRLSKDTGIPYTTISELCTGKTDINKCAADTVYKLASYFECDMKDIMNYVDTLDNYSGKYQKQKFKWSKLDDKLCLSIEINGKMEIIELLPPVYSTRPKAFKKALTELLIDNYLEEKEMEKLL